MDKFRQYAQVRGIIFVFHSIGPLAAVYSTLKCMRYFLPGALQLGLPRLRLPPYLEYWVFAEAGFYLAFLCYKPYLQRAATHPPLRSPEERRTLFNRVESNVTDPELYIRGWFKQARVEDIGRESVKTFLAWAFFEGRIDAEGKDEAELEQYVQETEAMLGRPFTPGPGTADSLRLTLDPIDMWHRGLLWYSIIALVDSATYIRLYSIGFTHYRLPLSQMPTVFPYRPLALTALNVSPAKQTSYWLCPHTSKTRLPVLFLHGIGVGLHFYIDFFRELGLSEENNSVDGQVGILAIEIMPIATRITREMPSKDELLAEISAILAKHKWDRFVVVSHSYGTIINTHILYSPTLGPRVSSALMIDPVCFLLHRPDVAYNFTVRYPRSASEWLMFYFAGKDPGVAHTLGRRFFWSENVLWLEDLEPMLKDRLRLTASLSGEDIIVNTAPTARYLTEGRVQNADSHVDGSVLTDKVVEGDRTEDAWKHAAFKGKGLEVMWHEELDHAEVFDSRSNRAKLIKVVRRYCEGS